MSDREGHPYPLTQKGGSTQHTSMHGPHQWCKKDPGPLLSPLRQLGVDPIGGGGGGEGEASLQQAPWHEKGLPHSPQGVHGPWQ
jgi:hypothetical protein